MNVLANGQETAILIPLILALIQIQIPLVVPPVQVRDIARAVIALHCRAVLRIASSTPLLLEYS